jgi:hypothetical protein
MHRSKLPPPTDNIIFLPSLVLVFLAKSIEEAKPPQPQHKQPLLPSCCPNRGLDATVKASETVISTKKFPSREEKTQRGGIERS